MGVEIFRAPEQLGSELGRDTEGTKTHVVNPYWTRVEV